jgi:hypothetical protein
MLIEVKVKVARIIDGKTRKRTETYIVDKELFSEAEYMVMSRLTQEQTEGTVESFEIQGLKMSQIKEVAGQFNGAFTYIIILKDIWLDDDGTEKYLKYKVLLDADDAADATSNALQLARQGYDMQVEGIKQVDYEYLDEQSNQEEEETENGN